MAAASALTGGISHELNNPLATILLQVQRLLRRVPEGSPLLPGFVSIERHTLRGRDLIRALIDYSRDKPLGRERVKVGQLVEGVTQIARSQARGRDVFIEDTDRGISKAVLPHIFDPFFTTKPVGAAAGLGLSLAQRRIEKSGGHIDVDPKLGVGTTMRVWLPASSRRELAAQQENGTA